MKTQKPLFFAWLVSLEGPDQGKDYRILKDKTSIGKQENSDIVIKRDFISRNHAVLLYENQKFVLTDLHSTNHTYVNDEMISKTILKDNDIIKFGEAIISLNAYRRRRRWRIRICVRTAISSRLKPSSVLFADVDLSTPDQ